MMKTILLAAAILWAARLVLAGEPNVFEIHAVSSIASDHTKEYSVTGGDNAPETVLLDTAVLLDHTAIVHTYLDHEQGNPVILVQLTAQGRTRWGEITTTYLNKQIGIVFDGRLRSVPVIKSPMFTDRLELDGHLTQDEAKDLVKRLNQRGSP